MKLRLVLFSLCLMGLHAPLWLNSAEDNTKPKAAENAPKGRGNFGADLAERLQKEVENNGPNAKIDPERFADICRELLKQYGAPAEEVDKASIPDILRMVRERAPMNLGDLKFLGGRAIGEADSKALTDQYMGFLDGHRPGAAKPSQATITLRDAEKDSDISVLGSVVKPDGYILTKASEIAGAKKLECSISKDHWVPAKLIREWKEHDLALVKVEGRGMGIVEWSTSHLPEPGTFISAVGPHGADPVAIGVISVAPRSLLRSGQGFLGVGLEIAEGGLKVSNLTEGGAAAKAGLKEGDIIVSLDGETFPNVPAFAQSVSRRKAGEEVSIKYLRDKKESDIKVPLGDRGNTAREDKGRFGWMNKLGSELSDRKDDFPRVFQTDFPLNAHECGGPVTDLDGNVLGMVIARAGRVDTFVLPSDVIREVLAAIDWSDPAKVPPQVAEATPQAGEKNEEKPKEMKEEEKPPVASDSPEDIKKALEQLDENIQKAQETLDQAREQQGKLMEQLKKLAPETP